MLTCRDVENFMIDYVDGGMAMMTRLRFNMHIAMCADCKKYLQSYRNAIQLEKRIFTHPEDEAIGNVPDEIIHAILNASAENKY